MTNINCALDCIYQKDGKCSYNLISVSSISYCECVYYIKKNLNNEEKK